MGGGHHGGRWSDTISGKGLDIHMKINCLRSGGAPAPGAPLLPTPLYVLNFEPHKPTYKISIEVGRSVGRSVGWSVGRSVGRSVSRSVGRSLIARIQPTIIRLMLRRSAIIFVVKSTQCLVT